MGSVLVDGRVIYAFVVGTIACSFLVHCPPGLSVRSLCSFDHWEPYWKTPPSELSELSGWEDSPNWT